MTPWPWWLCLLTLIPPADAQGDPLPPGARARLGSARWRHGGPVTALAYLPDGKGLVSLAQDGGVRLWEAPSGKRRWIRLDGNRPATAVAVSPDGLYVGVADGTGQIYLLDPATGREVHRWEAHRDEIHALAFSADGQWLASGSDDDSAAVWDVATAARGARFTGHQETVRVVAFHPNGHQVASGGDDRKVRLWDRATGREVHVLQGHRGQVEALAFAPDGKTLVTAGEERAVRQWDVATGREIRQWPLEGTASKALAFTPDGKQVAAVGGRLLGLWDAQTGAAVRPPLRVDYARSLAFAPDGQTLALGGDEDQTIHLLTAAANWVPDAAALAGGPVRELAFAPDGRLLATVGPGAAPQLWDPATGQPRPVPWQPRKDGRDRVNGPRDLRSVTFLPGGTQLLTTGDGRADLWDLATGEAARAKIGVSWEPASLRTQVSRPLAVSADRARVLTHDPSLWGKPLKLWDAAKQKLVRTLRWKEGRLTTVALAPDGATAAIGAEADDPLAGLRPQVQNSGLVYVWAPDQEEPRLKLPAHPGTVTALAFAPDGRALASAGDDDLVRLWDVAAGRERRALDAGAKVAALAFAADGRTLAAALENGTIRVWEVVTGRVRRDLEGHAGAVLHLAFAPDGRTLATAGADGTVLLWDPYAVPADAPPADREALWADLAAEDAGPALTAVARLAAGGDAAVGLVAAKLAPVAAVGPERLRALVAELAHPRALTRERATAALAELGGLAEAPLRQALDRPEVPAELDRRAAELLSAIAAGALPPGQVRGLRAVEVLELIATPAARRELERLAAGAAGAPLTVAAQAALTRLGRPAGR